MKAQDKIRDDIGPEDFGIPAEFAERARNYAAFALSHAAGQDGEQCRAASGDREAMAARLRELICEYWDLAYDEGVDKRNSDTPAGDANRVANEIETIIRALSRGVPEGDMAKEKQGDRESYSYHVQNEELARHVFREETRRIVEEQAAIAAQRKEGK